jgi:hypothetical protein
LRQRLASQWLGGSTATSAAQVVRHLGAVQAQDYPSALWALGLRLPELGEAQVEAAVAAGEIVRTWPLRRTLHLVPAEDVRWMLALRAPGLLARNTGRYRALGLDAGDFARARRVLGRALAGGGRLTRAEAYAALARGGVAPTGQRGIHLIAHLAQEGVLCGGPRQGRQPTFVLLDEWVPAARELARDEALATLATRYFTGHGPATLQDFAWWSGLPARDARRGAESASALRAQQRAGRTWYSKAAFDAPRATRRVAAAFVLPPWDEYLVAYRDRSFALGDRARAAGPALIGRPLVLLDGRVRGTWRRELAATTARVTVEPWAPLGAAERRAVERAVARYGRFLGREVTLVERSAEGGAR